MRNKILFNKYLAAEKSIQLLKIKTKILNLKDKKCYNIKFPQLLFDYIVFPFILHCFFIEASHLKPMSTFLTIPINYPTNLKDNILTYSSFKCDSDF